ncbi:hypothetical protein WSK_1708 [Novosphingobium sp. Rr 2-17]|uniref:hypothetical protein n=1 Tax=Novosphingobium sp. Rr 2-17 TaxID=555793 RepID=UPI000269A4D4|nr:hypothetical protein [Novosphingobium sp. Rr 2-17]EIZ79731.1 hypothetical protein WSK_1708 [Novosphingobium sp. Rr 2-17]
MKTEIAPLRTVLRTALTGAIALAIPFTAVSAQNGPPPGAPGGAPAGAPRGAGPPPGTPGGGGDGPLPPLPPEAELTEGQKLVDGLTPPNPGGIIPVAGVAKGAPTPSADPRDFSGTWYHNQPLEFRIQRDMFKLRAPYTMAGAKVMERRVKSTDIGKPFLNASAICRPPGVQWQLDLNFPFQIFQTKDWLKFVFQEYHGRWDVAFNPATLPAGPSYQGKSVAHWDGDTLVVETSGFRQDLWLDVDGTPLSKDGKLTQRIRKVTQGNVRPYLEMTITIEDPKYYTNAWTIARTYTWFPQAAYFEEYDCEEQIGDPAGGPDAGLVPEPKD